MNQEVHLQICHTQLLQVESLHFIFVRGLPHPASPPSPPLPTWERLNGGANKGVPLIDSSQLSAGSRCRIDRRRSDRYALCGLAVPQVTEHAPTPPPIQMAHASGEPAPNVTCHRADAVSGDRRHFEVNTRGHAHTHTVKQTLLLEVGVVDPDQQGSLVMKLIMSCDSSASPPCEGFISVVRHLTAPPFSSGASLGVTPAALRLHSQW